MGLVAVVSGNNHGSGVRTDASFEIMEFGEEGKVAIVGLLKLIEYKNIHYSSHVAAGRALAAIGQPAQEILLMNLDSDDINIKYYSAFALKEMNLISNKKIDYILENDWKEVYQIN